MIVTLGHIAVMVAFLVSLAQVVFPLIGAARNNHALMQWGRGLAIVSFALILAGFASLMYAHITDDFSVLNVALTSHTQKPLLYKITGVWASHEGSMMLWMLILTGFGAALALLTPAMPLLMRARALAVQAMTGAGFLSFILFTSNPYLRTNPVPLEGNGLNPILQDPGLAFHPPFLYLGYVGFSSVFALAAAYLLTPSLMPHDLKYLRPWALAAWGALTFGIAMGSWWAYYELGWGGFWFWDPVENAALLPWLAGTALVHSLLAVVRGGALMRWTLLLSILTFSLSLLGTFLVRSGVLTSVHTFAVDPARGFYVLLLLGIAVVGALTLYAFKAPKLPEEPLFTPVSREAALVLNNLFLCTACATLLAGTLYPLLLDAIGGGMVSVGAPYFNITVVPLMLPAFVLMTIGPLLRWGQSDLAPALKRLRVAALLALLVGVAGLYFAGFKSAFGLLGLTFAVWVIAGTVSDGLTHRNAIGPYLPRLMAHGGLGLALLGVAASAFGAQYTLLMKPHDVAQADGYRIEFAALDNIEAANFQAARGTFIISAGAFSAMLLPEQRYYPAEGMALSHVAIQTNLFRDLYLALGEAQDDGAGTEVHAVRLHINPLAPFIWIGGTIMALGGLLGAAGRRKTS